MSLNAVTMPRLGARFGDHAQLVVGRQGGEGVRHIGTAQALGAALALPGLGDAQQIRRGASLGCARGCGPVTASTLA